MKIKESASNGFASGLVMDYNEFNAANTTLTNALNATFITYNGNEAILQNDLGNGRVESAYLPEGFIPIGTTSFGGIIYIVSYNPQQDVCQVGSFPSPERNFTEEDDFFGSFSIPQESLIWDSQSKHQTQLVIPLLSDKNSNEEIKVTSGDKFTLSIQNLQNYFGYLQGIVKDSVEATNDPCVKLILGVRKEGQLRELNMIKDLSTIIDENFYKYIATSFKEDDNKFQNIDSYREKIETPYNIVNCNISGTLCLIVKIITLDSFNETHKIKS